MGPSPDSQRPACVCVRVLRACTQGHIPALWSWSGVQGAVPILGFLVPLIRSVTLGMSLIPF